MNYLGCFGSIDRYFQKVPDCSDILSSLCLQGKTLPTEVLQTWAPQLHSATLSFYNNWRRGAAVRMADMIMTGRHYNEIQISRFFSHNPSSNLEQRRASRLKAWSLYMKWTKHIEMMIRYRDHCALVIAYIISRTGRAGQWSARLFSIIQFYLTDQSVVVRSSPARAAGYTMGSSGQRGAAGYLIRGPGTVQSAPAGSLESHPHTSLQHSYIHVAQLRVAARGIFWTFISSIQLLQGYSFRL